LGYEASSKAVAGIILKRMDYYVPTSILLPTLMLRKFLERMSFFFFENGFSSYCSLWLRGKNLSHKGTKNTKTTLKNTIYQNVKIYFLGYGAFCKTVAEIVLKRMEYCIPIKIFLP
jgi:hypothetical protein